MKPRVKIAPWALPKNQKAQLGNSLWSVSHLFELSREFGVNCLLSRTESEAKKFRVTSALTE